MTDLAALAIVVAGALLAAIAFLRLREISSYSYRHPGPRDASAVRAADLARYLGYAGVVMVVVGCVVGVMAAIRHQTAKKPRELPVVSGQQQL